MSFRNVLYLVLLGFVVVQLWALLRNLFYIYVSYPKWHRKRFSRGTSFPSVHLFVPCKNGGERFAQVLEAFTAQDYPGIYSVTFVTDSAVDPAAAVIQR
ncbi:MAG: hypothetical protein AAGJ35_03380, partial [Myxococcota bacterium]